MTSSGTFTSNAQEPVDVIPRGEHREVENAENERNVRIMQLAINGENDPLWAKFRKVGKRGRVIQDGVETPPPGATRNEKNVLPMSEFNRREKKIEDAIGPTSPTSVVGKE